MGLYPFPGRGERPALKGEHRGRREYKVGTLELLPQEENICLVYKVGWHGPETQPGNPGVERTWTKKEALASFRNPRRSVIVYLEGDTCVECFAQPPELTLSIGNNVGLRFPIDGPQVLPEEDPREGGRPRYRRVGGPAAVDERSRSCRRT